LKRLRKVLGELRDWDVNLEIAHTFSLPEELIKSWTHRRDRAAQQVRNQIRKLNVEKLLKQLRLFLDKRHTKLNNRLKLSSSMKASAYRHLEPYLIEIENRTRNLEVRATSAEELHQLRLSIKDWRYFLTEFFGLTNLQLVHSQQLLGKFNDLQRVLRLMQEDEGDHHAKWIITSIKRTQNAYLEEFKAFRKSLPLGLRPAIISLKYPNNS
jgi:CHAD domain-containing protein